MKAIVVAADQGHLADLGAELERAGLDPSLYADVADARRAFESSTPDIVVVHSSLGGRATLDLYRAVRRDGDCRMVFVGVKDVALADDSSDVYLASTLSMPEVGSRIAELVGIRPRTPSVEPEPVPAAAPPPVALPPSLDPPRRPRWVLIAIIVVLVLLAIMFLQPRLVGGESFGESPGLDGYHVGRLYAGGAP
jgi:hypothetical protein